MDHPDDGTIAGTSAHSGGDGGGGAVDDLTPPTMTPASESGTPSNPPAAKPDSNTPQSAVDIGATLQMERTRLTSKTQHMSPGTSEHTPATFGYQQIGTVVGGLAIQDLTKELLLRDAPRIESNGSLFPSLNGIPLVAKLGQGGMGSVYYGVHPRLQSEVAVKVLPLHLAEQDPTMIQRFFREAQIAAKVRSPHLVSVIDVNKESGLFFLVMEYVAGVTMAQYLKQLEKAGTKGMPQLDALDVCIAASMGLEAAHQHGVVHRDLKPENVMVPYKSRQERTFDLPHAKLMDLGLARSEEGPQSLTNVQAAMGTPGYMAPEQALDAKTADKRSDVFGMGATLYALLAGQRPFGKKDEAVMKVLMATMHEPHEPITNLRPDVSPMLAEIIDACLDKRPENRFADATQLLRALRRVKRTLVPDAPVSDDTDVEGHFVPLTPRKTGAPNISGAVKPGSGITTVPQTTTTPAAKPARGMVFYGGIAAALLIVIGGAGVALNRGLGKTDIGGNNVPLDPKMVASIQKLHENNLSLVVNSLKDGDLDTAEFALRSAVEESNRYPGIAELKIKDDEARKSIETWKQHQTFLKQLGPLDAELVQEHYEQADALFHTLNKYIATPEDQIEWQKRAAQLVALQHMLKDKTSFAQSMATASNPATPLKTALAAVNEALKLSDKNPEALDLQHQLLAKQKLADDDSQFQQHMEAALANFKQNHSKEAKTEIEAALEKRPGDIQAKELSAKIIASFDVAERQQIEKERAAFYKEQFGRAFTEADTAFKAKDADVAMTAINRALQFDDKSTEAAALKAKIETLQTEQRKAAELAHRRMQFDKSMETAEGLLRTGSALDKALSLADEAAGLKLDDAATAKATDLKRRIQDKQEALLKQEQYNTDVANARKRFKENDDIEGALKLLDEALAIQKEGPALKLQKEVLAEKKRLADIAEHKRQIKETYDQALKSNEELAGKRNFAEALQALKNAEAAATELGKAEKDTLAKQIGEATQKLELFTKLESGLGNAATLAKNERYDEALAALTAAGQIMDDPRLPQLKQTYEAQRKELDSQVATRMKEADGALQSGGVDAALTSLKDFVAAHPTRTDLQKTAAALGAIQTSQKIASENAKRLADRYVVIAGRLGTRGSFELDRYKRALEDLTKSTPAAVTKLTSSGIDNAVSVADELKNTQEKALTDATKYIGMLEDLANRPVEPVRPFTPQTETPRSSSSGGGRSNESDRDR